MIGIAADDITGAGDIGIMFAKAGYAAHLYSWRPVRPEYPQVQEAEVVVLDTDSRFDKSEEAYQKVYDATRQLKELGCTQFINKTCSVFRGNIGAEFDAMLDALGESFAVVVLGFPKNGRTTVDGIHYVHGKKLEDSEFRNDPVHPMTRSDLVGILAGQTKRKVAGLTHEMVSAGAETLGRAIEDMRSKCNYLIVDVTSQESLAVIAEAVQDEKVLCGSSALSEELALFRKRKSPPRVDAPVLPPLADTGIFVAAGSLMPQTAAQVEAMAEAGVPVMELDTLKLLEEGAGSRMIDSLVEEIAGILRSGEHAVLHSSHRPEQVRKTKDRGRQIGLSNTDVSRLVSGTIAEITERVLEETGQSRAVIAGGDTSAAVCGRLGIQGMRIVEEIQPGLPSCVTFGEKPLLLVLKSGSFGKPDFFHEAIRHLRK